MTATFVLHGFLRGSKGSVPDCPLRSIPIHSAGGARYAFGLPSICLQPVFNLSSTWLHTLASLRLCSPTRAVGSAPTEASGSDDPDSRWRKIRSAPRESSLASPHLRVLTCESSLASPHLRVLTPCDTPTWRVVEVRRYLCGSPRKDKGNSQTSHRMCR
jgi:hypothetical protein